MNDDVINVCGTSQDPGDSSVHRLIKKGDQQMRR